MKTLFYFVWMTVAVLLLGARCDRENKPDVPPQTPPVEEPQEPEPVKKTPDDFDGPSIREGLKEVMKEHKLIDDTYVTFFQFCNDSNHTVFYMLCSRVVPGMVYPYYLLPGEKDIHTIVYGYLPEWGYDYKLLPLQSMAYLGLYYDQPNYYHTREGIYEICRDFTQTSETACIGDESQWQYDEFGEHIARWTYIFTDGDYARAVKISAERTYDPEWID